jgi:hypothetical protein
MNHVLSTPLDVYQSYTKPFFIKTITLNDLIKRIKEVKLFAPPKDSDDYDRFKADQNVVTVNGYFSGKPSYKTLTKATGLLFCEIDTAKELSIEERKALALTYKNKYFQLPFVLTSYLSMSKTSAHFIIQLDDELTKEIDPKLFKRLYEFLSITYFDRLLDMQCQTINRFTCISYDPDLLLNPNPKILNKEDISTLYHIQSANADIGSLYRTVKKDIKGLCPLYEYYPIFLERLKYKPVAGDEEGLLSYAHNYLENPDRIGYKKHKYVANFKTCISEQHFFNDVEFDRNQPVFYPDGIHFCQWVLGKKKVKVGNRKNTLLAFSRVILFNTPFISQVHFIQSLFDFNKRNIEEPLEDYEVMQVGENNFDLFHDGKMEFLSDTMRIRKKYLWFSSHSTLTPSERMSISKKVFKDNTTARIYAAIEDLQGIKRITQSNIAEFIEMDVRTVRRHLNDNPALLELCLEFNPHIVKPKQKIEPQLEKIITNEVITEKTIQAGLFKKHDGCRYTVEPDVNITPKPSWILRKNPDKKFKIYSDEDGYSLKTNSWNGIKEYKGVPIECYEEQHRNNDPLIIDTPELSQRQKNIPTETRIKRRFQLPATVESLTDMVKEGKITPEQYSLMDDSILHMPTTPVEFFS